VPGLIACGGSCKDPQTDPANCGRCGNACAAGSGCVAGACTPNCATLMCGTTCCQAPAGGACCTGGTCLPQHPNGLGQSYYDCSPPGKVGDAGTYTLSMAREAADAWNASAVPVDVPCGGGICLGRATLQTPTQCAVWCWAQPQFAGYVSLNTLNNTCQCPFMGGSDFTWN
jgi:hypothetical protein